MKKIIYGFIGLIIIYSLCACSNTTENNFNSEEQQNTSNSTVSKIEDFYAEQTDKGFYIVDYVGDAKIIKIPEEIDGKKIEGISYSTFFDVKIEEIYFSSGIKEIEARTFENQLKLKKVVLNEGLTKIGDSAFINCYKLSEINIPSTVEELGVTAFSMCEKLATIELPEGLKKIGQSCFTGNAFNSIIIPASVENLTRQTVNNCSNLKDIYFLNPNVVFNGAVVKECPNATVHGAKGSTAEAYAKENDIPFVAE